MNFRKAYGLESVDAQTKKLFEQLSPKEYLKDVFMQDVDYSIGKFTDPDKSMELSLNLFSTQFDKEIISERQTLIEDLANLFKDKKNEINTLHFISATKELDDIVKGLNHGKKVDLRKLGPTYHYFVLSIQNIIPLLQKKPGTQRFAKNLQIISTNYSDVMSESKVFGEKGYILQVGHNELQSLVNFQKEPIMKSKIMNYYRDDNVFIPSDEAEKVFKLFEQIKPIYDSLRIFYGFGSYVAKRERKGKPVCFPIINNDRIFEVYNGVPIASSFDHDEKYVPFNENYTQEKNHFIYSGAHSGGKTHRLTTIGLYYWISLMGLPGPADKIIVPFINNLNASIVRQNVSDGQGKGSLESELQEIMNIAKSVGDDDLVLIDELFDTTKPEFTKYVSVPILQKFDNSKSAIHIVYHAARTICQEKTSFVFKYPELNTSLVDETILVRNPTYGYYEQAPTRRKIDYLYPTYNFLEGIPDGKIVQAHAKQKWKEIRDKHEESKLNKW
ncbi:MAG: hypothetical protein WC758_04515 [Candidatus Woesearchaeota archaeon]|jgi:hypothetical protein